MIEVKSFLAVFMDPTPLSAQLMDPFYT